MIDYMTELLTEATPLEALLAWTEKFSAEHTLGLSIWCEIPERTSLWRLLACWEDDRDGDGRWRVDVGADSLRALLVQAFPKLLREV